MFHAAADAPIGFGEIHVTGKANIDGADVKCEARAGGMVWPTVNTPGWARMADSIMLSVREASPFTITAKSEKATVEAGDKLTLTVKLERAADWTEAIQISGIDLPPGATVSLGSVGKGATEGKVELTLPANLKAGTYSFAITGAGQVPREYAKQRDPSKPRGNESARGVAVGCSDDHGDGEGGEVRPAMNSEEWWNNERLEGIEDTSENWIACPSALSLVYRALKRDPTERKMRLVGAACCRLGWHNLNHRESRAAVECAERFADGGCSEDELVAVGDAAEKIGLTGIPPSASDPNRRAEYVEHIAVCSAAALARVESNDGWPFWEHLVDIINRIIEAAEFEQFGLGKPAIEAAICDLMRDIFGNPFQTLELDTRWLTPPVVGLARSIYEEHAFDRMPILGDTLNEAGCDRLDILDHCRGSSRHARGCWLIDAILEQT